MAVKARSIVMAVRDFLSFPNPVNEKAARTVAFVVMVVSAVGLATSTYWLFVPLAYGFVARVLAGPRLSPLGRLASAVVAPRLGAPKPVPGPPKRFAQAIGATLSTLGVVVAFGLGAHGVGDALFALMIVAAGLESLAAVCLGCEVFALLMRAGLVPERVCLECADISGRVVSGRLARTSSTPRVRGRRAQLSRSQAISLRQAHGRRAAVTRAHERAHATARSRR